MSEQKDYIERMKELYPKFKEWYDAATAAGDTKRRRLNDLHVGYTAGYVAGEAQLDALHSFAGVQVLLQAILDEAYPPNTIVCSDKEGADTGAQLTAAARRILALEAANRAQAERVAALEGALKEAHKEMVNLGNLLNWHSTIPQSYAAAINAISNQYESGILDAAALAPRGAGEA